MNPAAARLVRRLVGVQFAVGIVALLTAIAFAPTLLLLDPPVIFASLPSALVCAAILALFALASTLLAARRAQPLLLALREGTSRVPPEELLLLYKLPARITLTDAIAALVVCLATLVRPLRPAACDLATQVSLVLLALTFVSAASLPMYVMMRSEVARVLELASVASSREALDLAGLPTLRYARVRQRFVFAVGAPVAFVAVGAALLVQSHVRGFETATREDDAASVVAASLDSIPGAGARHLPSSGEGGRSEALAAAMSHGLRVLVEPGSAAHAVVHEDLGETQLTVPLDDGHATVRFSSAPIDRTSLLYVLLALAGTALAALLGSRIGHWFVADVALATRAVRETGAADVLRGTSVRREARFASVVALMDAIDSLGTVFREFASAQETAIDASAGTERMRALFLASMSHDLKGPLNAILGFAQLVSRNPLSAGQQESLAIIEQRGRELLTLIQTILDSARVEARALRVSPEWTMVGDVVMSAILDARDLAVGSNVEVAGEIQPGVPRLFVDGARTIQALTAIISTAVRFTEKGVVRVRATLPPGSESLRIDVETQGRTVASSEHGKVFEAFRDPDRARRHGGLGLGLSLARSIFEIHGGNVQVDMTPGGGCLFHVHLPTSAQRVQMALTIAYGVAAPEDAPTLGLPPGRARGA